jgi:hypothetical protein
MSQKYRFMLACLIGSVGLICLMSNNAWSQKDKKMNDSTNEVLAKPKKIPPEVAKELKKIDPNFLTFDELPQELKDLSEQVDGGVIINIPKGKRISLPNGSTIDADGTLIFRNGVKMKHISKNGKLKKQFIKPDGKELVEGEVYKAPDGMIFENEPTLPE